MKFEMPLPRAGCTSPAARVIRSLLVAVASILSTPTHAVDLGTIGPTYGIAEPHLLDFIQQRLRDKERTGELQRLIEEARNRGVAAVRQPAPVEGVRSTETARSWTIDPIVTLVEVSSPAAAITPIIAPRAITAANRTSRMGATKAVGNQSVGHFLEWRGYKRFVAAIEYGTLGLWLRPRSPPLTRCASCRMRYEPYAACAERSAECLRLSSSK